jgi:hypothetical protein
VKYLAESEGGGVMIWHMQFLYFGSWKEKKMLIMPWFFLVSLFLSVQVLLPSGGLLTPRGLQTLGLSGLGSSSGFERLHYM